jgi:hypothetical protein
VYTNAMRLSSWTSPRRDRRDHFLLAEKGKRNDIREMIHPRYVILPFSGPRGTFILKEQSRELERRQRTYVHLDWPGNLRITAL